MKKMGRTSKETKDVLGEIDDGPLIPPFHHRTILIGVLIVSVIGGLLTTGMTIETLYKRAGAVWVAPTTLSRSEVRHISRHASEGGVYSATFPTPDGLRSCRFFGNGIERPRGLWYDPAAPERCHGDQPITFAIAAAAALLCWVAAVVCARVLRRPEE